MKLKKNCILFLVLTISIFMLSGCGSSGGGSGPVADKDLDSYDLQGIISTSEFNSPIQGAVIKVGDKTATTDDSGKYLIQDIEKGKYNWSVNSDNYQSFSMDIEINKDLKVNKTLVLAAGSATVSGNINVNNKTNYFIQSSKLDNKNVKPKIKLNKIGKEKYIEDEIIVKYKNTISSQSIKEIQNKENLNKISSIETASGEIHKYKISSDKSLKETINEYKDLDYVEWVEPNYIYYSMGVPSDNDYSKQWGNISLNLEAAWDQGKQNNSIIIAVVDSGIIPNHADLRDNLLKGADFVGGYYSDHPSNFNMTDEDPTDETTYENYGSHGTHVSGIIGAVGNNNKGIAGVNWNTNILPIRALGEYGYGDSWDISEGIYYAISQGVDIINLSLGGAESSSNIHEAIKEAHKNNIVVVAASGNGGEDGIGDSQVSYPAAYEETIAVGAINKDNIISSYSNYGDRLDFVAPGGDYNGSIYSTWGYYENGDTVSGYQYMQGTSMATPYVSGIIALLLADGVSPTNIEERLKNTAIDLGDKGKDIKYGYGLVDSYGAILNKKLTKPYIFAATENKGDIYLRSDLVKSEEDNSYKLNNVLSGETYIVSWRDVNDNEVIDAGDYFGEYENIINVKDNSNYSADIDLYYVTEDTEKNIEVKEMPVIK